MNENELGMNVEYEADYRGKYMPIEITPLINNGSEIGMKKKITAKICEWL